MSAHVDIRYVRQKTFQPDARTAVQSARTVGPPEGHPKHIPPPSPAKQPNNGQVTQRQHGRATDQVYSTSLMRRNLDLKELFCRAWANLVAAAPAVRWLSGATDPELASLVTEWSGLPEYYQREKLTKTLRSMRAVWQQHGIANFALKFNTSSLGEMGLKGAIGIFAVEANRAAAAIADASRIEAGTMIDKLSAYDASVSRKLSRRQLQVVYPHQMPSGSKKLDLYQLTAVVAGAGTLVMPDEACIRRAIDDVRLAIGVLWAEDFDVSVRAIAGTCRSSTEWLTMTTAAHGYTVSAVAGKMRMQLARTAVKFKPGARPLFTVPLPHNNRHRQLALDLRRTYLGGEAAGAVAEIYATMRRHQHAVALGVIPGDFRLMNTLISPTIEALRGGATTGGGDDADGARFRLASWNINGLCGEARVMQMCAVALAHRINVCAVQETHLGAGRRPPIPAAWQWVGAVARSGDHGGGGVGFLVHASTRFATIPAAALSVPVGIGGTTIEISAIRVLGNTEADQFALVNMYVPPMRANAAQRPGMFRAMQPACDAVLAAAAACNGRVVLCGDLNANNRNRSNINLFFYELLCAQMAAAGVETIDYNAAGAHTFFPAAIGNRSSTIDIIRPHRSLVCDNFAVVDALGANVEHMMLRIDIKINMDDSCDLSNGRNLRRFRRVVTRSVICVDEPGLSAAEISERKDNVSRMASVMQDHMTAIITDAAGKSAGGDDDTSAGGGDDAYLAHGALGDDDAINAYLARVSIEQLGDHIIEAVTRAADDQLPKKMVPAWKPAKPWWSAARAEAEQLRQALRRLGVRRREVRRMGVNQTTAPSAYRRLCDQLASAKADVLQARTARNKAMRKAKKRFYLKANARLETINNKTPAMETWRLMRAIPRYYLAKHSGSAISSEAIVEQLRSISSVCPLNTISNTGVAEIFQRMAGVDTNDDNSLDSSDSSSSSSSSTNPLDIDATTDSINTDDAEPPRSDSIPPSANLLSSSDDSLDDDSDNSDTDIEGGVSAAAAAMENEARCLAEALAAHMRGEPDAIWFPERDSGEAAAFRSPSVAEAEALLASGDVAAPWRISRALGALKNRKAAGVSGVCNEELKVARAAPLMLRSLSLLMRKALMVDTNAPIPDANAPPSGASSVPPNTDTNLQGGDPTVVSGDDSETGSPHYRLPASWRTARVVLIPKEGCDLSKPASWRPIALVDALPRLLARLLARPLQALVEPCLPGAQMAFRPARGCLEAAITMVASMERAWTVGEALVVCATDVKKAYDAQPQEVIAHEAEVHGLGTAAGHAIKIMTSGYSLLVSPNYVTPCGWNEAAAALGAATSALAAHKRVPLTVGIMQGLAVSPMLFTLGFSRIGHDAELQALGAAAAPYEGAVSAGNAYADDLMLISRARKNTKNFSGVKISGSRAIVNQQLGRAKELLADIGHAFQPAKCQTCVLLPPGHIKPPVIEALLGDVKLAQTKELVHLGIPYSQRAPMDGHCFDTDRVKIEQLRAGWAVTRRVATGAVLGTKTALAVYHSTVASRILYGAEVRFTALPTDYQKVQNERLRGALAVPFKNISSALVHAELGVLRVQSAADAALLRFAHRSLASPVLEVRHSIETMLEVRGDGDDRSLVSVLAEQSAQLALAAHWSGRLVVLARELQLTDYFIDAMHGVQSAALPFEVAITRAIWQRERAWYVDEKVPVGMQPEFAVEPVSVEQAEPATKAYVTRCGGVAWAGFFLRRGHLAPDYEIGTTVCLACGAKNVGGSVQHLLERCEMRGSDAKPWPRPPRHDDDAAAVAAAKVFAAAHAKHSVRIREAVRGLWKIALPGQQRADGRHPRYGVRLALAAMLATGRRQDGSVIRPDANGIDPLRTICSLMAQVVRGTRKLWGNTEDAAEQREERRWARRR